MENLREYNTTKTIQTSDWRTFGKAISCFTAAVKEQIDNSIHGILKAEAQEMRHPNIVDVNIDNDYVYVSDSGCGMTADELIDSMGYGVQLSDNVSMMSMAGTGGITSTAYINKENDDWNIFSRRNGEMSCLKAPWESTPHIYSMDKWSLDDAYYTIRKTKLSKNVNAEIDAEDLGVSYGFVMTEKNISMYLNGVRVAPIVPKGFILGDTRNTPTIIGEGDSRVEMSYIHYDVDENHEYGPYKKNRTVTGIVYFL